MAKGWSTEMFDLVFGEFMVGKGLLYSYLCYTSEHRFSGLEFVNLSKGKHLTLKTGQLSFS
jgi:hypothetical protein